MKQGSQQTLDALYKLRARLRSQIARLDSQITALADDPAANLRRVSAGTQKRATRAPQYQPIDGRA